MRAITISRAENLPIGELSRLSGVNIETIRYYEKIKILPPPPRTESGRRVYGPNEFRRLSFVRRSRELGFTIDEIRSLLALGAPGNASCREVREVATGHLEEIRTKIKDLVKLERAARENHRAMLREIGAGLSDSRYPRCATLQTVEAGQPGISSTAGQNIPGGDSILIGPPSFAHSLVQELPRSGSHPMGGRQRCTHL